MSKQTEYLREQARRAERLSQSVSSNQDCQTLKALAEDLDADAERLERSEDSLNPPS
jgi:predicted secreted Zn-dependent protease